MKTSTKKVTREEFVDALSSARTCINTLFTNTKFSAICEKFIELNKKTSKAHDKRYKLLTKDLNLALDKHRITNAVEKDGKLLRDKDGHYEFDRKGELLMHEEIVKHSEKIEVIIDEFLQEEIEVNCIVDQLDLPKEMEYDIRSKLKGFVFQNKEQFIEETA